MSYYRVIPGSADRARRRRREREKRDLETWTRNRGEFSGRTRSRDPEVRRRWCQFYGINFEDSSPRPRNPFYRGLLKITELSDSESDSSTGSSDYAIAEPDDFMYRKGSGRSMVPPSGDYIVTAHQYMSAFHVDGRPNSDAIFWERQNDGYAELWQSAGLMMAQDEFIEVKLRFLWVSNSVL